MIPATNNRDRAILKEHALELLRKNKYEGLAILIDELQDTNFELPHFINRTNLFLWAIDFGVVKVVKYLLENEPSIDINARGGYAILNASKSGNIELVDYLISQEAELDKHAIMLIRIAFFTDQLDVVKHLIAKKHIRVTEETLYLAKHYGKTDILEYLQEVLKNDSSNNS